MDASKRKEFVSQFTFLAVVFSGIVLIASLFLGLIKSDEATFSINGIKWLIVNDPGYWFVITFAVAFPVAANWLVRYLSRQLYAKQQTIEGDQERIKRINQFAQHLIHDEFDEELIISAENDELGNSLVKLRDTLKQNRDKSDELRLSEEQRRYVTDGLARISEILRNNLHDLDQLSFGVIKELTKKVNAIQGGFYMLDDTDKNNRLFNLIAFFAYDRRKFADKQIKWGDGLVGTCAMEQKVIHLKNVPESYIAVTSGLGEANPDSILIVPMQYENEIYGVLELASLNKFEANHVDLITHAAESIASTLSAVRTSITTQRLLEESKSQTQAMISHEEEMRQNMEELQATQEEATRQAQRFMQLEDTINQSLIKAEFNNEGRFQLANPLFYAKFEYDQNGSTRGKMLTDFIAEDNREHFHEIWKKVKVEGNPYTGYLKHVSRSGKNIWTMASLSVTKTEEGELEKIIFLGFDISEEISKVEKNEILCEMNNKTGIRFELDINGNFHDHNHHFMHMLKYTQKDLKSLVIFDMIEPSDLETFNKHWETVINGNTYTGSIRLKSAHNEERWINGSFAAIRNLAQELSGIIFTGFDITHEKVLEKEVQHQADTLKKQEKLLKEGEKELSSRTRELKNEIQTKVKEAEHQIAISESIIEESPEAIVSTGQDNRVRHFNKAAETLWGMKRQEVIDQDVSLLFPERIMGQDEVVDSFVRPGDHKITGRKKQAVIVDKSGKEKKILIQLARTRIDNENSYTAFLQALG